MDHLLQLHIGGEPCLPERAFAGTTVFYMAAKIPTGTTTATVHFNSSTLLLVLNGQRASQWVFADKQEPIDIPPFAFFAAMGGKDGVEMKLAGGASTVHCMGFSQRAIPLLAAEFERYADIVSAPADAATHLRCLPPRFLPYTVYKYLDRLHKTDKQGFALNVYSKDALYQVAKLYHTNLMAAAPKPRTTQDEELMRRAEACIQEHFADPTFNIDALAQAIGQSRRNLYRLFENQQKPTPQKLILRTRLEKAHTLLKDNNHTVGDVVTLTGFNHPSYFAAQYKSAFGHLPNETR